MKNNILATSHSIEHGEITKGKVLHGDYSPELTSGLSGKICSALCIPTVAAYADSGSLSMISIISGEHTLIMPAVKIGDDEILVLHTYPSIALYLGYPLEGFDWVSCILDALNGTRILVTLDNKSSTSIIESSASGYDCDLVNVGGIIMMAISTI